MSCINEKLSNWLRYSVCHRAESSFQYYLILLQDNYMDEFSYELSLHKLFMESLLGDFVGRRTLLKQCISSISKCKTGLFIVTGSAGIGKSAFMVRSSGAVIKPIDSSCKLLICVEDWLVFSFCFLLQTSENLVQWSIFFHALILCRTFIIEDMLTVIEKLPF